MYYNSSEFTMMCFHMCSHIILYLALFWKVWVTYVNFGNMTTKCQPQDTICLASPGTWLSRIWHRVCIVTCGDYNSPGAFRSP